MARVAGDEVIVKLRAFDVGFDGFAIRLAQLVKIQSVLAAGSGFFVREERLSLLLPAHGRLKIACFRASGGERVDVTRRLPGRQLTGSRRRFHGAGAVAKLRVGANSPEPCPIVQPLPSAWGQDESPRCSRQVHADSHS